MSVRMIRPGDPETETVAAMVDGTFDYYGGPYWEWKYADPSGPEAVIMIAEEGGDVVGCNHYLVLPYQLGRSRTLTGLAGGDLYVTPEFRRRHIASDLSLDSRLIVTETHPDTDFVVMFTWRALGSHYERLLGYTKLDPGYREWSKRLAWGPQIEQLAGANAGLVASHQALARVNHLLHLEVKGAPPLELRVGAPGFTTGPTDGQPVIRLRASSAEALSIGRTKWPLFWMVAAIATGRWRVWGSPRALREALGVAGAYLKTLRTLRRP